MMWGTSPDEELRRQAESGALLKPATLRAQTDRLITDPRQDFRADNFYATLKTRDQHHLYGPFLSARFNINLANDCVKQPLGPGENPVGDTYTKLDCERTDASRGVRYVLQTRYFRKPGQLDRDPITGNLTTGQYEAYTRAEIWQLE